MKQIIFCLILMTQQLAPIANAETTLAGSEEYVVRDCTTRPGGSFSPTQVPACGKQVYCLNAFVDCKFIAGSAIRAGGDWEKIIQTANMDWMQFGAAIFCKMENNGCNVDLDSCANQSAKEAGCSMKKLPGHDWLQTVPRESAK